MSDPWINRLVVSGTLDDVNRFRATVADGDGQTWTSLSFSRLQAQLAENQRTGLDDPVDPWDDNYDANPAGVSAPDSSPRQEPGLIDLSYPFSLDRYEPDTLLFRASRVFARLCFVLGWVAPGNDEAASRFIHNGHTLVYSASGRQRESIRAKAYRRYGISLDETSDEAVDVSNALWADVEADWALLDTVISHWDGKVARVLREGPNAPGATA